MITYLLAAASTGLTVTGDLGALATAHEWGVMVGCLGLVAVLMVCILLGVALGGKAILKLLHQTMDGYAKLTLSIDRLSDSQDDLQEWLKAQTTALQTDIDGIEESIKNDHSMLIQHDKTIKEHTEQIDNLNKKKGQSK